MPPPGEACSETIEIACDAYRLTLDPVGGGAITRFDWRGQPLFRARCGPGILDQASFALVPFSNRIAFGRFCYEGKAVALAANFPGGGHPHTLHGFGWQARWHVAEHEATGCLLVHDYEGCEWPWAYRAEQRLDLSSAGLRHRLRVQNLSDRAMPVGLGLHPYLPRTAQTRFRALHRGEWQAGADGLPQSLACAAEPVDWWNSAPVATRTVDTVYTDRRGALIVEWPERDLVLTITPSDGLRHTVVYCPADADFFCVEPVTHSTDALNDDKRAYEMARLEPGDWHEVIVDFQATLLD